MLVKSLLFTLLILQLAPLHEACRSGVWKRRKRGVNNIDHREVIRDYFTNCIPANLKNQNSNYDWRSNVDFTIIMSDWYRDTDKAICATEDEHNTIECWQQELEEYLNNDTSLMELVKKCIVHYFEDYQNSSMDPRYDRKKREIQNYTISDPADPNLISKNFSNCISQNTSDVIIDYHKLLASIERHAVFRKCNKDLLSRPPPYYRKFFALTRPDKNLSGVIENCTKGHFPSGRCKAQNVSERMTANPDKGKYNLGDEVTFNCISPHHELVGLPTSTCQGSDKWSSQVPTCKDCGDSNLSASVSRLGSIKSPNYPKTYPSNSECWWTIIAPPGYRVLINFTTFELERCCDRIRIYDAPSQARATRSNNTLISAALSSSPIRSNFRYITIKFTSDSSVERKGFHLTFKALLDCGDSNLSASVSRLGSIKSPNYPKTYPSSSECWWTITAPKCYRVLITFTTFELERFYDRIQLYDAPSQARAIRIRSYNTLNSAPSSSIRSKSNYITIKFTSDGSVEKKGFHMTFRASRDRCS